MRAAEALRDFALRELRKINASPLFRDNAREPDEEFRLQFEALRDFTPEEKRIAQELLDSLILKHAANRVAATAQLRKASGS